MATAVAYTGVSGFVSNGGDDVAWDAVDYTKAVLTGTQNDTKSRKFEMSLSNYFDAIHDGCTIDQIKLEFNASISVNQPQRRCTASFTAGLMYINATVNNVNTNYSQTIDGAGITPAMVRNGTVASACFKDEDFYSAQFSMSFPTVTVWYTDHGMPQMVQFSL